MPKDATIDKSLHADALVDVVDNIRRAVHGALGTRPWKVAVITRRWSGDERGVGTPTTTVLELDPDPKVKINPKNRLGPAGQEGDGTITVSGISLRYAQHELQPDVDSRTEVAWRLTEQRGTKQRVIWGVLVSDPLPRRGDKAGDELDWIVSLNQTTAMGPFDGVSAP